MSDDDQMWKPREETVADRMFAAHRAWDGLSDAFGIAIEGAGAGERYEFTVDDYDRSVEIYAPDVTNAVAVGVIAMSMGFDRCWVHPHGEGRSGCGPGRCKTSIMFGRNSAGEIVRTETDGWPGPSVVVSPAEVSP